MKHVSLFGATGSVGQGCADVIAAHPDLFSVHTVTANTDCAKLAAVAKRLNAKCAVIANERYADELRTLLAGTDIRVTAGQSALLDAASEPVDLHVAAIVGAAGLEPLIAALGSAKSVAIANKEPLVAAGRLVVDKARVSGCKILPLDSEHNAIFQVLEQSNHGAIDKIILTASGGPFRDATLETMAAATPKEALAHPNWTMGAKISIDSATMMNKALEIIEAHHLFQLPANQIDVIVHPQSIVHSMVAYQDGSVLAQMGAADMRTPITYCLGWPDRIATPGQKLDIRALSSLTFVPVEDRRFPAINLAYAALESGQGTCIAFNAANEVAVEAFLNGKIGFLAIVETVEKMIQKTNRLDGASLADILAYDKEIRTKTTELILNHSTQKKHA